MSPKLEDVFGVSNTSLRSYFERTDVDGLFQQAIKSDKQIVVYGSSKQGKTALVSKHVPYNRNIVVRLTPKTRLADIYKSILREADISEVVSSEEKNSSTSTLTASLETGINIPLLATGKASGEGSIAGESGKTESRKFFTNIDLNLADDVATALRKANSQKKIILENFHYLNEDIQKEFSYDLRTFQELGIRFVILGVWREKNRLNQFNGDLQDRIIEVPVEPWKKEDFISVIEQGEKELNIRISDDIKEQVISNAFDSIGVVQELVKNICLRADVHERVHITRDLSNIQLVSDAIKVKSADYAARNLQSLRSMAQGLRLSKSDQNQALLLPLYFVKILFNLDLEELIKGIHINEFEREIKAVHHRPSDVRRSDTSSFLNNLAKLQSKKNINPPIFDYDKTDRIIRIIDSTFYFFIRNTDKNEIEEDLNHILNIR